VGPTAAELNSPTASMFLPNPLRYIFFSAHAKPIRNIHSALN